MSAEALRERIREIPDFPKPGILFYDITTVLKDPASYKEAIDLMLEPYQGEQIDIVVGMESRGFIFSAPMAYLLGAGLVPVRKLGKLPAETITVEYALEYGSNTLEIHRDAIQPGQKVLIVDDLLATGGTVRGTIELVERLKGEVVGLVSFLIVLVPDVSPWFSLPTFAIAGYAMGLAYSPLALIVLRQAPIAEQGRASAAISLTDSLGTALGTGVTGALVAASVRGSGQPVSGLALGFGVAIGIALLGNAIGGRLHDEAANAQVGSPVVAPGA